jgi:cell division septation protein DedD
MQKTALSLVALGCSVFFSPADASPVARVTALESPAWVQQANNKVELKSGNDLEIGDHIITSDTGRVDMQLWSNASLRLYTNSEIRLQANKNTGLSTPVNQPLLYVHKGKVCVDYKPQPGSQNIFELNIGNTIVTAKHHHSYICVLREDGWSFVNLRDGSVQISHTIDPSMIILSEAGTELRINDDGSYDLLKPGAADSIAPEDDKPFITGTDIATERSAEIPAAADIAAAQENVIKESKSATDEITSGYIYTVYLFSTKSEESANKVNQKFLKAGHQSEIIVIGQDASTRYRVGVSGFETRQAARKFSNSVIGKLGISSTWIGAEKGSTATKEAVKNESKQVVNEKTPTANENTPGYIYTVYLFSTRSEDVADEVNQRLQKAGHKSKIITSGKDPAIRYRIAVSGFESRQSAKDFSNSVVGKLGISDSWIGKERTNN